MIVLRVVLILLLALDLVVTARLAYWQRKLIKKLVTDAKSNEECIEHAEVRILQDHIEGKC
jgi:hypothetical protein